MEVKLEKSDWEAALRGSIDLLKNAMAQTEVYKVQVATAEAKIAEFPEDPKETETEEAPEEAEKPEEVKEEKKE